MQQKLGASTLVVLDGRRESSASTLIHQINLSASGEEDLSQKVSVAKVKKQNHYLRACTIALQCSKMQRSVAILVLGVNVGISIH